MKTQTRPGYGHFITGSDCLERYFSGELAGRKREDLEKAETSLAQAVALEPENFTYRYAHAEAVYHLGRTKEAVDALNRVLEGSRAGENALHPELVYDALVMRGLSYQELRQAAAARADLQGALELFDRGSLAAENLSYSRKVVEDCLGLLGSEGQFDQALMKRCFESLRNGNANLDQAINCFLSGLADSGKEKTVKHTRMPE